MGPISDECSAIFQGGFIPDIILFASYFYTQHDLPVRMAFFFSESPVPEITRVFRLTSYSNELPCRPDHQLLGRRSARNEGCRRAGWMAMDVLDRVSDLPPTASLQAGADVSTGVSSPFVSVSLRSGSCRLHLPRQGQSIDPMVTSPSERRKSL